jgi:hypothetical protein
LLTTIRYKSVNNCLFNLSYQDIAAYSCTHDGVPEIPGDVHDRQQFAVHTSTYANLSKEDCNVLESDKGNHVLLLVLGASEKDMADGSVKINLDSCSSSTY